MNTTQYVRCGNWFSAVENGTVVKYMVNLDHLKFVRVVEIGNNSVVRFQYTDGTHDDLSATDAHGLALVVQQTIMGLKG